MFVLAGCQDGNGNTPTTSGPGKSSSSSAPSLAGDVPHGFDPCKDIPADVVASENLEATNRKDTDAPGGVMWRGCGWVKRRGYAVAITTTNLTLDTVRARNFRDAQEFNAGGRHAISTRQFDDAGACVVNVEMKGGSLDISLDNPKSNPATGSIDACQLARSLAEKIAPSIPAGA
ncbi:DUF3558 domain-containing protein [Nocardia sp. NPDC046473]|uniref:DUF3558 domain-containing protein n=1 Tax=Nocardia sp. NPDC046473 TaxID=3155733 RepID=UPI003402976D